MYPEQKTLTHLESHQRHVEGSSRENIRYISLGLRALRLDIDVSKGRGVLGQAPGPRHIVDKVFTRAKLKPSYLKSSDSKGSVVVRISIARCFLDQDVVVVGR